MYKQQHNVYNIGVKSEWTLLNPYA